MGYLTKEVFQKPTLFSILTIVGIVIGIPYGFYALNLKGGQSLAGFLTLIGVFFLIIILAIDRGIVSKIKPLKLTIIESFLLILCLVVFLSNDKKIFIDLEDYKEDYFVIIYNNGELKDSKLKTKFIFHKECQIEENCVILSEKLNSEYRIKILSPKEWNSLQMRPDSLLGFKVEFCNSEKRKFNQYDINLIVEEEIKRLTKKNYR